MILKRTKIIMFRATIIEKKIIEKKAKTRKMNTARYCRMVALERKNKSVFTEEELRAFENLHYIRNSFVKINNLLKDKDSSFANQVMKTVNEADKVLKIFSDDR